MQRRSFFLSAVTAAISTMFARSTQGSIATPARNDRRFRVFEPRDIKWASKPSHALAMPTPDEIPETMMDEINSDDFPMTTRSEGLAEVARRNAACLNAWDRQPHFHPWAMLIEVDAVLKEEVEIPAAFTTITVRKDGTGTSDACGYYDVRLVRPTDAELARYAVGATV